MLQIRQHMVYLDAAIQTIDEKLDHMTTPYAAAIRLLCTIPGMKRESAITILSEIGTDMTQFDSSKRLCSWAGLTPGNNQSAGKKKSVRITRAGVYIKPMLVQAAHAAVKCTRQPYYKVKYENIARRRGKKRAIIAIARHDIDSDLPYVQNRRSVLPHRSSADRHARGSKGKAPITQNTQRNSSLEATRNSYRNFCCSILRITQIACLDRCVKVALFDIIQILIFSR